jgi:Domain of unknown function DUF29
VEDMGVSQRHAVVSHLRVLLTHVLKWNYQVERRSESWLQSMLNAQIEIETYLEESPSLRPHVPALIDRAYPQACRVAAKEAGLNLGSFPPSCPWSAADLLDPEGLPKLEN